MAGFTNYDSFIPHPEIEPTLWQEPSTGLETQGTVLVNDLGLMTVAFAREGLPTDVHEGLIPYKNTWHPEEIIDVGNDRQLVTARVYPRGVEARITGTSGRGEARVSLSDATIDTRSLPLPGRERASSTLTAKASAQLVSVGLGIRVGWPRRYGWTAPMGHAIAMLDPAGGVAGNLQMPQNHCEEFIFFPSRRPPRGWLEYLQISHQTIPNRSRKDGWYWAKEDNWVPDDQADLQENLMAELVGVLGIEEWWGRPVDVQATFLGAFERLNTPNPTTDIVVKTNS